MHLPAIFLTFSLYACPLFRQCTNLDILGFGFPLAQFQLLILNDLQPVALFTARQSRAKDFL
jgi:hypothetical protein